MLALLDASGEAFAAYRYDAWGNPLGEGNVTTGVWAGETTLLSSQLASEICERQLLRYAGYLYEPESGLYYLSARDYDPATRQFLSKDLSRNDGEQSAYQYCGGNPISNVDPSGLETKPMSWSSFSAERRAQAAAAREALERAGGILAWFAVPLRALEGMDAKDLPDITEKLMEMFRTNATWAGMRYWEFLSWADSEGKSRLWAQGEMVLWYGNAVAPENMWDLKTLAADYGIETSTRIGTFFGEPVSLEDIGNLQFGYVGGYLHYMGMNFGVTLDDLKYASVQAAKKEHVALFNEDDSYTEAGENEYGTDHHFIEVGYEISTFDAQYANEFYYGSGFYFAPPTEQ